MTEAHPAMTDMELDEDAIAAVLETVASGWLTMGPQTAELEAAFAAHTGAEHAVALSSGTAALHLACLAVGVAPNTEALVPAFAHAADAHAPRYAGADVVLCDSVSPADPAISVDDLETRIGERAVAVIVVHPFGYPLELEPVRSLCERRGLALIEDCAMAAGARFASGRSAGTAGAIGCFSFACETELGVGEGGIAITDDAAIADRIRLLRSHAMTSGTWDRHRTGAETYDVVDLGFNYRIDEPRATLARQRLEALGLRLEELRRVVRGYRERLGPLDGLQVPFSDGAVERSGHSVFPVLVEDREARDAVRERLMSRGVETTRFPALTQLTAYAGHGTRPAAEAFADRHLALPLAASLDDAQIELVVAELADALLQ